MSRADDVEFGFIAHKSQHNGWNSLVSSSGRPPAIGFTGNALRLVSLVRESFSFKIIVQSKKMYGFKTEIL